MIRNYFILLDYYLNYILVYTYIPNKKYLI